MARTRISVNRHPDGDGGATEVVDVVCPTGLHGGGEVAVGVYGTATCGGCGALLVELDQAPPQAAGAVKAERERVAAAGIPANVLPTA